MDLSGQNVRRGQICLHTAGYADDPAYFIRVGTDAITTDELRDILEQGGKLYTPIKIDDINNLGAIKIRLRSLIAAIEARKPKKSEKIGA
jgi:predicted nucleotide-binding protein (sugar kinase/HSP70/actin superfamily)